MFDFISLQDTNFAPKPQPPSPPLPTPPPPPSPVAAPKSEPQAEPITREETSGDSPSPETESNFPFPLASSLESQPPPRPEILEPQSPPPPPPSPPRVSQQQNVSIAPASAVWISAQEPHPELKPIAEVKVGAQTEGLLPYVTISNQTVLAPSMELVGDVVGAHSGRDGVREVQPAAENPLLFLNLPAEEPRLLTPVVAIETPTPASEPASEFNDFTDSYSGQIIKEAPAVEEVSVSGQAGLIPTVEERKSDRITNQSMRSTGMVMLGYYDPFPESAFADAACGFGGMSPQFQVSIALL